MVVEGSRIFEDNQQDLVVRPLTCLPLPPSILLPLFLPPTLLSFFPASKLSLRNQTMSPCLSGPHLLPRWALLPKDVRGTCEPMFFLILPFRVNQTPTLKLALSSGQAPQSLGTHYKIEGIFISLSYSLSLLSPALGPSALLSMVAVYLTV